MSITISPATTPTDFHLISSLENRVFYADHFSIVAFGPQRDSEANVAKRAEGLAKTPKRKGDRELVVKAEDQEGDIVGAAAWSFVLNRGQNDREVGDVGEVKKVNERKEGEIGEREGKEEGKDSWGIGANVKFCEDVFIVADEHMLRSCSGKDYATPECQRQGIGSKLLEQGLQQVDERGLQCVLAASKEGLGLYKKFGFVEFETMVLKLWEYEGGEGFSMIDHVVMHRPARKRG